MDVEAAAVVDHLYRALASGYNPALRAFVPISKAELRQGAAALDHLISPHGSRLMDLVVDQDRAAEIREESRDWPSVDLGPRQLCDLELLINGGYSPLDGYLGAADHQMVCSEMRLADGIFWPIPVVLNISDELADSLATGDSVALRDGEGVMIAALNVDECFERDLDAERVTQRRRTVSSPHQAVGGGRSSRGPPTARPF